MARAIRRQSGCKKKLGQRRGSHERGVSAGGKKKIDMSEGSENSSTRNPTNWDESFTSKPSAGL